MYAALRHASIEWVIMGLPRNFAMTYNFGRYEAHQLGAQHWRLTFADYPLYPHAQQGFLQAGAAQLGNDTQYEVTILNPESCWIDITWKQGKLPTSAL